ncbi:MAG: DUF1294 domain-containing protein [Clostridia bacterium]|jgi:uncharacterized membrane protein YsdA (DUF1294 family)|nr:DUF1294 domain-containing protein [Clostridia bacterium]
MKFFDLVLIFFFLIMSLTAVLLTIYDKRAAKAAPDRRTPEKTLMLVAFFFGSFAMYITMKLIRHKTKHKKFMIGIPIFMALHAAFIIAYIIWLRPMLPVG